MLRFTLWLTIVCADYLRGLGVVSVDFSFGVGVDTFPRLLAPPLPLPFRPRPLCEDSRLVVDVVDKDWSDRLSPSSSWSHDFLS